MAPPYSTKHFGNYTLNAQFPLDKEFVLIPIKAFSDAKKRLDPALSHDRRITLVQEMASQVFTAAAPLPIAVICDTTVVADWARDRGALVIWETGRGLDSAVEQGVGLLGSLGVSNVTVAHSDLPIASSLNELGSFDGVTLVPDRRNDGTNVIRVHVDYGFRFSYGIGSFNRHLRECRRLRLPTRVLRVPSLTLDIDLPEDLHRLDEVKSKS